jgi:hypothetical protein
VGGRESLGVVRGSSGSFVTSVGTHKDFDKNTSENDFSGIGLRMDSNVINPGGRQLKDDIAARLEPSVRDMDTSDSVFVTLEDISSQAEDESRSRRRSDGSNDSSTVMVPTDPMDWTGENVKNWLNWVPRKFEVSPVNASVFPSSGRLLCSLSKEDFSRLAGPTTGATLHTHLSILRGHTVEPHAPPRRAKVPSASSTVSVASPSSSSSIAQPSEAPCSGNKSDAISSNDLSEEDYRAFLPGPSTGGQIQLWQFLLELLDDKTNKELITWEGGKGEFRLIEPDDVAKRWGERKSKDNMNYDKLSRALRYYYDKNILTKISGKRYAYKFDFHSLALACQAQQSPTPSDTKLTELTDILAPFLSPPAPKSPSSPASSSTTPQPSAAASPHSSASVADSPSYRPNVSPGPGGQLSYVPPDAARGCFSPSEPVSQIYMSEGPSLPAYTSPSGQPSYTSPSNQPPYTSPQPPYTSPQPPYTSPPYHTPYTPPSGQPPYVSPTELPPYIANSSISYIPIVSPEPTYPIGTVTSIPQSTSFQAQPVINTYQTMDNREIQLTSLETSRSLQFIEPSRVPGPFDSSLRTVQDAGYAPSVSPTKWNSDSSLASTNPLGGWFSSPVTSISMTEFLEPDWARPQVSRIQDTRVQDNRAQDNREQDPFRMQDPSRTWVDTSRTVSETTRMPPPWRSQSTPVYERQQPNLAELIDSYENEPAETVVEPMISGTSNEPTRSNSVPADMFYNAFSEIFTTTAP